MTGYEQWSLWSDELMALTRRGYKRSQRRWQAWEDRLQAAQISSEFVARRLAIAAYVDGDGSAYSRWAQLTRERDPTSYIRCDPLEPPEPQVDEWLRLTGYPWPFAGGTLLEREVGDSHFRATAVLGVHRLALTVSLEDSAETTRLAFTAQSPRVALHFDQVLSGSRPSRGQQVQNWSAWVSSLLEDRGLLGFSGLQLGSESRWELRPIDGPPSSLRLDKAPVG